MYLLHLTWSFYMSRSLKLGAALLFGFLTLPAFAASSFVARSPMAIENIGNPDANPEQIGTAGQNISARKGLRRIVPPEFKILVHKDAKLPSTVSWSKDAVWTDALQQATSTAGLKVSIDWNNKSVFINPVVTGSTVALDTSSQAPKEDPTSSIKTFSNSFSFDSSKETLVEVVAKWASVDGWKMTSEAKNLPKISTPSKISHQGTLQSAMSELAPKYPNMLFTLYPRSKVVTISDAKKGFFSKDTKTSNLVISKELFNGIVAESVAPKAEQVNPKIEKASPLALPPKVSKDSAASPSMESASVTSTQVVAPPMWSVSIKAGDRLNEVLNDTLRQKGWILSWKVPYDMLAQSEMNISEPDLKGLLAKTLTPLNLSADIYYNPSKIVVVTPQENRAE